MTDFIGLFEQNFQKQCNARGQYLSGLSNENALVTKHVQENRESLAYRIRHRQSINPTRIL